MMIGMVLWCLMPLSTIFQLYHDGFFIFITTYMYAISAYHHKCCEFEPHSGEVYSIQHYVMKFVPLETGTFVNLLLPNVKLKEWKIWKWEMTCDTINCIK
jgi:hypothetical protein